MNPITVSIDLTDSQLAGLEYVTNVFNKGKDDPDKITIEQYAATALQSVIQSYADQRSSVRRAKGLELYNSANPVVQATVDSDLGLSPDYPTGNE